jgi:hypothetical protein
MEVFAGIAVDLAIDVAAEVAIDQADQYYKQQEGVEEHGCCFWSEGIVERKSAKKAESHLVPVAEVKPGDYVQTSNGFRRVVLLHEEVLANIIRVTFCCQDGQCGIIGLTPDHLIYTTGDQLQKSSELEVGCSIQARGGTAIVTALSTAQCPVRCIRTTSGELLVDGVRISSYALSCKFHYLTRSVAWMSYVSPTLPDRVFGAAAPGFVKKTKGQYCQMIGKRQARKEQKHAAANPSIPVF